MKRIITFIAAISMVVVAMAQAGGITVSTYNKDTKETKLQFFNSDALKAAIEAAQPNDTIYFAAGVYSLDGLPLKEYVYNSNGNKQSYPVIDKPLVFIGAGGYNDKNNTSLRSSRNIVIDLLEYENGTENISFEGLRITDNNLNDSRHMYYASNIENITFRNFKIYGFEPIGNPNNSSKITNLLADRSEFTNLLLGSYRIGRANILNSRIFNELAGACYDNNAAATLDHCYIQNIKDSFIGLIRNSLIYYDYSKSDTVLEYCGYYSTNESSKTNCNKLKDTKVSELDADPSKLPEECVSDDGTPCGSMGGIAPFSLYPSYPTPDGSKSSVLLVTDENGTKKLKVSVGIISDTTSK